MIAEKYKNNCPLNHSTLSNFVSCDCNFGTAIEVWYFKEQQLDEKTKELESALEVLRFYAETELMNNKDIGHYRKWCIGKKAREFLKKYKEKK